MPKVIIVGCGVAGPVLATLLKSKGYHPVVYERIERDSDGGISLMCAFPPLMIYLGTSTHTAGFNLMVFECLA